MGSYHKVLVGTDGSESSFRAVDRAAAIAADANAQLILVTAYRPMSDRERKAAVDQLGAEAYKITGATPAEDMLRVARDRVDPALNVALVAQEGDPVEVLVRVAHEREADLVVVGNKGLNSLTGRLLGSVPSVVAHRSPVDILIVHTT